MIEAATGGAIISPTKATNSGSTQIGVTIGRRPSTATMNSKSSRPSARNSRALTTRIRIDAARIQPGFTGATNASAAPATASAMTQSGEASGAVHSKNAAIAAQSGSTTTQAVAGSRA